MNRIANTVLLGLALASVITSCTVKLGGGEWHPLDATASAVGPLVARGSGPFFGRPQNVKRWLKNVSSDKRYDDRPFTGSVKLYHISSNLYFFDQQNGDPLGFRAWRKDAGKDQPREWKIQPESFFTTGASVPRFLWNTSGFGPMDFAKAAMIHDWLFEAHHRWCVAHRTGDVDGMKKYAQYADPDLVSDLPADLRALMNPLSIAEAADIMVQCMDWEIAQCKRMKANLADQMKREQDPVVKDGLSKLLEGLDELQHGHRVLGQYHWAIRVPAKKYWRANGNNSSMSDTIAKLKQNGSLELAMDKAVISPALAKNVAAVATSSAARVDRLSAEATEERKAENKAIVVKQGRTEVSSATVGIALVKQILETTPTSTPTQVRYFHAGDAAIAKELAEQISKTTQQETTVLYDVRNGTPDHRSLQLDQASP